MPGKRTTMRKLRDVLRLRHAAGLSILDISRSTKLSVGGIQKLLSRAQALHLSWPLPAALDDTRLAQLFYPGADTGSSRRHQVPDWPAVHQELKTAACDQTAVVGRIYPTLPEPGLQLLPVL